MKKIVAFIQDSDIELLRDVAKKRMQLGQYSLQILSAVQLMEKIAQKRDSSITVKEIEAILKDMGERKVISDIKAKRRENR